MKAVLDPPFPSKTVLPYFMDETCPTVQPLFRSGELPNAFCTFNPTVLSSRPVDEATVASEGCFGRVNCGDYQTYNTLPYTRYHTTVLLSARFMPCGIVVTYPDTKTYFMMAVYCNYVPVLAMARGKERKVEVVFRMRVKCSENYLARTA